MPKIITCSECGEEKPHEAKGICSKCYQREYHKANRLVVNERHKKYYDANSDQWQKRHELNRENNIARMSKYYADNHESIRGQQKEYSDLHTRIRFINTDYIVDLPKQPSGYDYHHICYDHDDPAANVVLIPHAAHMRLHHMMRKFNIKVPHINTEG